MKFVVSVVFLFVVFQAFTQNRVLDKLEVYYEQGHYGLVYRKANQLLNKPEYDFSIQPTFYKSLSLMRLATTPKKIQLKHYELGEARDLYLKVLASPDASKVIHAHLNQLVDLKSYLNTQLIAYKTAGNTKQYDELKQILDQLFDDIPDKEGKPIIKRTPATTNYPDFVESKATEKLRNDVITYANQQLGIPYKWAGVDTAGFDCSGFTSYVFAGFKKELPRRAVDQYQLARKVDRKNVRKGDLVFFDSGSGISHVGIIVSEKGQELTMIHASSSKGVVITSIDNTPYWLDRLVGFGTFIAN